MNATSPAQRGFTLLELLVVFVIIGVMAIALAPIVSAQITDARVHSMIQRMQKLAADAQNYSMSLNTGGFDAQGIYVRTTRALPPLGANQIAILNARMGTHYPAFNYFGTRFRVRPGAADRVFVTTRIPRSVIDGIASGNFAPPGASARRVGGYYELTAMAPTYGLSHYLRRSRTIKRLLRGRNR